MFSKVGKVRKDIGNTTTLMVKMPHGILKGQFFAAMSDSGEIRRVLPSCCLVLEATQGDETREHALPS